MISFLNFALCLQKYEHFWKSPKDVERADNTASSYRNAWFLFLLFEKINFSKDARK